MQVKAREIVNSEEYQNFVDQNESFISKIHSENFLSEDIIDEENAMYNYDVINERLSGTSFESAEEFVREYEKMFYSAQKLVKKYPGLKSELLSKEVAKENTKREIENEKQKTIVQKDCVQKFRCKADCVADKNTCKDTATAVYLAALAGCTRLCGTPIAGCVCVGVATGAYATALYYCNKYYKRCKSSCELIACHIN